MEFKVDGCRSGIEEFTQNLFRKIQREFFDLSRWSMNFAAHYDRGKIYDGKSISLVWKPSKVVYDYLFEKYTLCENKNRVYILNVRAYNFTNEEVRNVTYPRNNKHFGHIRYHHKKCTFDDQNETIDITFLINSKLLSYSRVNEQNPDILTRQRIYLILRVPFLSRTLGFPYIHKASNDWRENHTLFYTQQGKAVIPAGGGPIRYTCSMQLNISDVHGIQIVNKNPFCSNQYCIDYKIEHNLFSSSN